MSRAAVPVSMLGGALLACGLLLVGEPARACGGHGYGTAPPRTGAPSHEVTEFSPLNDSSGKPQPRNVALLFGATTDGPLDEAILRRQIGVTVTLGGASVAGAISLVDSSAGTQSVWQWLPTGATTAPVGHLQVTVTNTAPNGGFPASRPYDVTVEDRVLVAPRLDPTIALDRNVIVDAMAPVITCTNPMSDVATCGPPPLQVVPTHNRVVPSVKFTTAGFDPADEPYLGGSSRSVARNANGDIVAHAEDSGSFTSASGAVALGGAYLEKADTYCVAISTWLRSDPSHPVTVEKCASAEQIRALDLTLSAEAQDQLVTGGLSTCENPTFPDGYTGPRQSTTAAGAEAAPAAAQGCAAAPSPRLRPRSASPVLALGIAAAVSLAALHRRRRRRLTCSGR